LSRKDQLIIAKGKSIIKIMPETDAPTKKEKPIKASAPKMTPKELKTFYVEWMAKARAARKTKSGN
jgi:hypothetical protein